MDPKIVVALIALASALSGSVIGTFFGPMVKWRYDNRLKMREDRKDRIAEWREGIASLREAEKDCPVEVYDQLAMLSRSVQDVTPIPRKFVPQNPDNAVATTKNWYVTLHPYVDSQKAKQIVELEKQPLSQRKHAVSTMLREEVARIERAVWGLV